MRRRHQNGVEKTSVGLALGKVHIGPVGIRRKESRNWDSYFRGSGKGVLFIKSLPSSVYIGW